MRFGLNRRSFLRVAVAGGLVGALDWLLPSSHRVVASPAVGGVIAFRRSGRGRHVSNAAKKNNANRLYANFQAAALGLAHPGDRSRVVSVVISAYMFDSLFRGGRVCVDLRHDLHTLADYRALQSCLSGPGVQLPSRCTAADHDGNGTADLRDFARFQQVFTGP